ncbi:UNVERIFIED_CONTAM: hypothetical protein HDU68_000086 [Siphonaria sp. JEL0065]|nr:hypothetical protein HDU68_000086 [Siphonaria sp. JEL0065]
MSKKQHHNFATRRPQTPTEALDTQTSLYISSLGKDESSLKQLKQILSKAPSLLLNHFASFLIEIQLTQTDSVSRFFALQLIVFVFDRSHAFREIVVGELVPILQRTVGIQGFLIPGPQQYAQKCKALALASIVDWFNRFGKIHRQLEIARYHLRKMGLYKLDDGSADSAQARQEAMRQERVKRERHEAYIKALEERDEKMDEIQENINKLKELFGILVNGFESIAFGGSASSASSTNNTQKMTHKGMVSAYGLGTTSYTLEIEIPSNPADLADPETDENKILYDELRECSKLQGRLVEMVQRWIRVVSLEEIEAPATVSAELKRLIDLKSHIENLKSKAELLISNAGLTAKADNEEEEDFDDEVFEEIPIQESSTAPSFLSKLMAGGSSSVNDNVGSSVNNIAVAAPRGESSSSLASSSSKRSNLPAQPKERLHLPAGSTIKGNEQFKNTQSLIHNKDLLKVAPIVDYNQDLYYWDKKDIPFNTTGIDFHHRFLGDGKGENFIPEAIMQDLRKRTVVVEMEHVEIPPCRARLRNGSLCTRRDKVKCPFHGVVVPRDDNGDPLDPNHVEQRDKGKGVAFWEDLEREVNQAIGEATIPKKRGAPKTALQEELELLKKKDNVKTRLEKSMKRFKKSK